MMNSYPLFQGFLQSGTLPETNKSSPLKMDAWNTIHRYSFFLGRLGLFSGPKIALSFREVFIPYDPQSWDHSSPQSWDLFFRVFFFDNLDL